MSVGGAGRYRAECVRVLMGWNGMGWSWRLGAGGVRVRLLLWVSGRNESYSGVEECMKQIKGCGCVARGDGVLDILRLFDLAN